MRTYATQMLLQDRLINQGDTSALYEISYNTGTMWTMAGRCKRHNRLQEAAALIRTAYSRLEQGTQGRQWVCRGGETCTSGNGQLNKEVPLNALQFLSMASSVASSMLSSGASLSIADQNFVNDTVQIIAEHLVRYGTDWEINRLLQMSTQTAADVTANSDNQLSDKHLMQLALYAELSNLLTWQGKQGISQSATLVNNQARMRSHVAALSKVFIARSIITRSASGREGALMAEVDMAEVDRGFWKLMPHNGYSGYTGSTKPVSCSPSAQVNVASTSATRSQNIGWDLNHARRLVHGLDALERNRYTLQSVFGLSDAQLPSPNLGRAYAASLVNTMWNGDRSKPLFSNYWGGTNGWYLTQYDAASGTCVEGFKPYGQSDSFTGGGFATWAKHFPLIGELAVRLYDSMSTTDAAQSSFMVNYYQRLSVNGATENKAISQFMFLPTLVGVQGIEGW
jgi:hypothetical protein